MFKFKIGDKVFSKSLEKEATIKSMRWEETSSGTNIDYELFYEADHYDTNPMVTMYSHWLGRKDVYVRVLESDLEGIFDQYEPKGLLVFKNDDITKEDVDNMRAAWDSVVVKKDGVAIPTGKYPSKIATWKGWMTTVNDNIGKIKEGNTPDEGHCDDQFAGYRFDDELPLESKHYILYSGDCIDAINYSVNGIKVDILSTDSSETISMKVKLSVAAHMNSTPLVVDVPSCDHQWLPYEGLTQRFEYCKHCDAKK